MKDDDLITSEEWRREQIALNEQLMLAELHVKELEDRVRKLEFEIAELVTARNEANEERYFLRLIVQWFVAATTFDVWRVVAAKALRHVVHESAEEDE